MPTYRAAPTMLCHAPAKAFPDAVQALQYARTAADGHRAKYSVYRCLGGALLRLWTYSPSDRPA